MYFKILHFLPVSSGFSCVCLAGHDCHLVNVWVFHLQSLLYSQNLTFFSSAFSGQVRGSRGKQKRSYHTCKYKTHTHTQSSCHSTQRFPELPASWRHLYVWSCIQWKWLDGFKFVNLMLFFVDVWFRTWRGRTRPCRKVSGSTTRSRGRW